MTKRSKMMMVLGATLLTFTLSASSIYAATTNDTTAATANTSTTTQKPAFAPFVHGTILSIDGTKLMVQGRGQIVAVTLDAAATYDKGVAKTAASVSDLAKGTQASFEGTVTSNVFTATKVHIQVPQVMGMVKSVEGNSITLQGYHGIDTVLTVNGNTKYTGDYAAGLSAIKTGSFLAADVTVSGTAVTADTISSAAAKDGKGFGPGMGGRHGSKGRGGGFGHGGRGFGPGAANGMAPEAPTAPAAPSTDSGSST